MGRRSCPCSGQVPAERCTSAFVAPISTHLQHSHRRVTLTNKSKAGPEAPIHSHRLSEGSIDAVDGCREACSLSRGEGVVRGGRKQRRLISVWRARVYLVDATTDVDPFHRGGVTWAEQKNEDEAKAERFIEKCSLFTLWLSWMLLACMACLKVRPGCPSFWRCGEPPSSLVEQQLRNAFSWPLRSGGTVANQMGRSDASFALHGSSPFQIP
ncbi:hypothetical protein BU16DRAFT_267913 [Lophium mytilinum]|uniref:Uncharacterized protein n=1 Tax=Lophium mytilinum TaxID=390894 RepID=A0A6A6R4S8_9PEZI|nr:hypothetical protein BU16DRAFT_267913 [Lophium mytilinum]